MTTLVKVRTIPAKNGATLVRKIVSPVKTRANPVSERANSQKVGANFLRTDSKLLTRGIYLAVRTIYLLSSKATVLKRMQFFSKPKDLSFDESLCVAWTRTSAETRPIFTWMSALTRASRASWCAFQEGRLVVAPAGSALGAHSLLVYPRRFESGQKSSEENRERNSYENHSNHWCHNRVVIARFHSHLSRR